MCLEKQKPVKVSKSKKQANKLKKKTSTVKKKKNEKKKKQKKQKKIQRGNKNKSFTERLKSSNLKKHVQNGSFGRGKRKPKPIKRHQKTPGEIEHERRLKERNEKRLKMRREHFKNIIKGITPANLKKKN